MTMVSCSVCDCEDTRRNYPGKYTFHRFPSNPLLREKWLSVIRKVGWTQIRTPLDDMWVFGYGSLVWKVDFKYELKVVGFIRGYLRRFYQHSIDHRGVPEKPGRVVTLIPSADSISEVWGVAYKIREQDIEEVTDHLDFREKNGYSKKTVTFHPKDKIEPFELTLYVATEKNESFAGPASLESIAKQVVSCHGPSGPNKEYVYNLAAAMRQLAPQVTDDHLFELEAAVRSIDPDDIS